MDREGPEAPAGGAGRPDDESVATGASARVGEVLSKAEARARSIRDEAERDAGALVGAARDDAARVTEDARRAAGAAARERAREISALRASIAARAGSLVSGLEGGELTAARLDELVAALGEAADRLLEEVAGDVAPRAEGRGP